MFLYSSDAPTFSIAETTRTDHFSLSLRKLQNRNRPEPTLKSKVFFPKIHDTHFAKIHDIHLTNVYALINEYHDAHS